MPVRDGDFIKLGPRDDYFLIVKVQADGNQTEPGESVAEEAGDQTEKQAIPMNAERAALEDYLKQQKNKSFKELYTELLEKEKTPQQRSKEAKKPQYDRSEVNWGMVDEDIVYADKAEEEIIRTDLLRMLPNLTGKHLAKIEEFEKKQRKMKMLTVASK